MSNLKEQLTSEMKVAMRAKDKSRLLVIRTMLSSIKQVEIDTRVETDDSSVLVILDKMLKQRRDSIKQYTDANRPELAKQESYEMEIIQSFMPKPFSSSEITQMIDVAMSDIKPNGMQDMGKIMGLLKSKMQGKADMAVVSRMIKEKLST